MSDTTSFRADYARTKAQSEIRLANESIQQYKKASKGGALSPEKIQTQLGKLGVSRQELEGLRDRLKPEETKASSRWARVGKLFSRAHPEAKTVKNINSELKILNKEIANLHKSLKEEVLKPAKGLFSYNEATFYKDFARNRRKLISERLPLRGENKNEDIKIFTGMKALTDQGIKLTLPSSKMMRETFSDVIKKVLIENYDNVEKMKSELKKNGISVSGKDEFEVVAQFKTQDPDVIKGMGNFAEAYPQMQIVPKGNQDQLLADLFISHKNRPKALMRELVELVSKEPPPFVLREPDKNRVLRVRRTFAEAFPNIDTKAIQREIDKFGKTHAFVTAAQLKKPFSDWSRKLTGYDLELHKGNPLVMLKRMREFSKENPGVTLVDQGPEHAQEFLDRFAEHVEQETPNIYVRLRAEFHLAEKS